MPVKKTHLKESMLLHVCCANCLMYPYHALKNNYDITVYFYNPNIHPADEYNKRLAEVVRVCRGLDIKMHEGPYECSKWLDTARIYADEPEGKKRCRLCYYMRLRRTAALGARLGCDVFASTLSVSPHKNAEIINETGQEISAKTGISYYSSNFKKNDGFKKTMNMAAGLNIYRQDYCGCIYSKKNSQPSTAQNPPSLSAFS